MTEPIQENTPPQPTEMDPPLPRMLSALPAAGSVAEGASPAQVPQDPQSSYNPQSSHDPQSSHYPHPRDPADSPSQPWGEYGSTAPALPSPGTVPAAGKADPLRGVLAGMVAAVVGALAWALLVAVTHYEVAFVALGVGYLVGWAVHRYGGVATTALAATSAAMAAVGILVGFVLAQLFIGAHDVGIGFMDAVDAVTNDIGWVSFITHATNGLGWLFLALGAFAAFRLVAQQRRR